MANIKKLDVLNSEGPVILAKRVSGSDIISLHFNRGGGMKLTKEEFIDFIYNGVELVNPVIEVDRYIFANFSVDMQASDIDIQNFLND